MTQNRLFKPEKTEEPKETEKTEETESSKRRIIKVHSAAQKRAVLKKINNTENVEVRIVPKDKKKTKKKTAKIRRFEDRLSFRYAFGCYHCEHLRERRHADFFGNKYNGLWCAAEQEEIKFSDVTAQYFRKTTLKNFYIHSASCVDCQNFNPRPGIRVDCYMSKLKDYIERINTFNLKHCVFVDVTNRQYAQNIAHVKHLRILAPSTQLLKRSKAENWDFEKYKKAYVKEMHLGNRQEQIQRLAFLAKHHTIFLLCVEKDPSECHRTILKEIIEGVDI